MYSSDEPEAVDFLHCWAVVCFRTNCRYNSKVRHLTKLIYYKFGSVEAYTNEASHPVDVCC